VYLLCDFSKESAVILKHISCLLPYKNPLLPSFLIKDEECIVQLVKGWMNNDFLVVFLRRNNTGNDY